MIVSYLSKLTLATALSCLSINVQSTDYTTIHHNTKHSVRCEKESINELLNNINDVYYVSEEYSDYLNKVDSLEDISSWRNLKKIDGVKFSKLGTINTAISNLELIAHIDATSLDTLTSDLIPLKKLLSSLDLVYEQKLVLEEKFVKMYDLLANHIKSGQRTPNSVPIKHLVDGRLGDCNDIIPAFYSILHYYGFDCGMYFGVYNDGNSAEDGYHVWLGVNLNERTINLDPTWYDTFIPLRKRATDISLITVKDKYLRKK
jgi:hypothetical protein